MTTHHALQTTSDTLMRFLGIDLGWRSGASGLCCLEWNGEKLELLTLDRKAAIADILDWVDYWADATTPALIAVDAPTLIPNLTGMRLPDRLTHQYFGKYHAGCYPANLNRPFAQRTVEFGQALEARGFLHAPEIEAKTLGRYQIEVFPHPAIVRLFGCDRILKYKKGRLSDRRLELLKLYHYIQQVLPYLSPSLTVSLKTEFPIMNCTGVVLKAIEDQLDSLICAYVGAHWWYWGLEKNIVLGSLAEGYIVIPGTEIMDN